MNYTKIESFPNFKEITSKEIIVMNILASLIIFSYQKLGVEILSYQILYPSVDKKKLFFIKYEEEKDKPSSIHMFETFVQSLRQNVK